LSGNAIIDAAAADPVAAQEAMLVGSGQGAGVEPGHGEPAAGLDAASDLKLALEPFTTPLLSNDDNNLDLFHSFATDPGCLEAMSGSPPEEDEVLDSQETERLLNELWLAAGLKEENLLFPDLD